MLLLPQPDGLQRLKKGEKLAELSYLPTAPCHLKSEVIEAEGGVETDPQILACALPKGEKEQGSGRSIIMLPPVVFRIIPQGFDIEVDRRARRLWPILHSE